VIVVAMSWFVPSTASNIGPVSANYPSQATPKEASGKTEVSLVNGPSVQSEKQLTTNSSSSLVPLISSLSTKKKLRSESSRNLIAGVDFGTSSQSSKGREFQGDGKLFNITGLPPMMKPGRSNTPVKIMQSSVASAFLVSSASVPVLATSSFSVNSLDQVGSLTAVFDQYRITEIEVWLTPRLSSVTSASANVGMLASAIDYDDSGTPSSFTALLDYVNAVISSGVEGHYRRWRPHAAIAAYAGAFTSYANVESPWIDAVSTGVQHYGLKTAITVTDTVYTFDLFFRLHTEWRNIR